MIFILIDNALNDHIIKTTHISLIMAVSTENLDLKGDIYVIWNTSNYKPYIIIDIHYRDPIFYDYSRKIYVYK